MGELFGKVVAECIETHRSFIITFTDGTRLIVEACCCIESIELKEKENENATIPNTVL